MKFKLTEEEKEYFISVYTDEALSHEERVGILAKRFDVTPRAIRMWAFERFGIKSKDDIDDVTDPMKIMVYDVESSQINAKIWWGGKQFVNHTQLKSETKVITVAWQWLGENKIHTLVWDENHNDKELLTKFAEEFNKADLIIGVNNDNFDNRLVQARFAKYNIPHNTCIRSFDIQKEAKKRFRIPSYSMAYMCRFFDVEQKLEHEGIKMWDKVEDGSPEEQKEYLQKMVTYNIGDIVSTSALYYRLRPFFGHHVHLGVGLGEPAWSCPDTGSENVELFKTTWTKAGTIRRIMISNQTGRQYQINNKQYLAFIDFNNNSVA